MAPEFVDDLPPPPSQSVSMALHPLIFSSFGEYARRSLGILLQPPPVHVAWELETPFTVASSSPSSNLQATMAFRFVDPRPFLPQGAQRVMVEGRPLITGRFQRQNNDLAIATFNPLPQEQVDFDAIRGALTDFLNHHAILHESIQPCPFGHAYVKFTYMHQRDLLIQNSPVPFGECFISFIPH